jgi:hypothetical protein
MLRQDVRLQRSRALYVGIALGTAACPPRNPAPQVELAGDPLGAWREAPDQAFARNLWDLQVYAGRLYLGYGDAITNTGPTDVIAYDPARGTFDHEAVVQEEAILQYRVFGDRLYIPGVDAVDSDDDTLYVRDVAGWTRIPLPHVAHTLDVAVRGTELCVAVQDRTVGGAVRCSNDGGATWQSHPTGSWRAVSLFQLGGALYASNHDIGIHRVDGGERVALTVPGVLDSGDVLATRPARCGDDVVFIAAQLQYTRDSVIRHIFGLFRASSGPTGGVTVAAIDVAGIPVDIFEHAGRCYAITNLARGGAFDVAIYGSDDNRTWQPRVRFPSEAMARSGEWLQGHFYVGLGCDPGHCTRAAGHLLRIAAPP